jgi:hypothetical protein
MTLLAAGKVTGTNREVQAVVAASLAARPYRAAACQRVESFRLDVGRPDHLGPFLSFLSDELAEI